MDSRRHLRRPLRLRGRALFGGGPASATLFPGRIGAGWRWAVGSAAFGALDPAHRIALPRRSALQTLEGSVGLCEHILAALLLADIDDCDLRFEGSEAPILDGSAAPWLLAIRQAGVRGPTPAAEDDLVVRVRWEGREMMWSSAHRQPGASQRLAGARTFIRQGEARALKADGTFPGARPGCALVLADRGDSALYGGRPRLPEEPLAHKLLDVLGDLAVWRARGRLSGILEVQDPGHAGNGAAIAAALADGQLSWSS
jgi:UDP-3-O-[3-hydroxymyristoyl] N-acetylglucosamine deacetylase